MSRKWCRSQVPWGFLLCVLNVAAFTLIQFHRTTFVGKNLRVLESIGEMSKVKHEKFVTYKRQNRLSMNKLENCFCVEFCSYIKLNILFDSLGDYEKTLSANLQKQNFVRFLSNSYQQLKWSKSYRGKYFRKHDKDNSQLVISCWLIIALWWWECLWIISCVVTCHHYGVIVASSTRLRNLQNINKAYNMTQTFSRLRLFLLLCRWLVPYFSSSFSFLYGSYCLPNELPSTGLPLNFL